MNVVIHCPVCKSPMSLPPGTKNGEFVCPRCGAQLRVGVGQSPTKETLPSETSWQSLPKPVKATQRSTAHGSAFWLEASEIASEAERQRVEQPLRESLPKPRSKAKSSSSPWVGCFAIFGVIAAVALVGIIAILIVGLNFVDRPTDIVLGDFQTTARGTKRVSKNQGSDTKVVGLESVWTGSGFIMTSKSFPVGVRPDLEGYLANLQSAGNLTSRKEIERLGLDGYRYEFEGRSMSSPSHTGEVFVTGNSVLIVMYMPGSEAKRLQNRRARYSTEQEYEKDRPDEFFESLRRSD